MEQCAVRHRAAEVRGEPAARRERPVHRQDAPVRVEAHLVVVEEIVPLAGRHHVVVAVGPDLHRPVPFLRRQRRHRREEVRLRLLAAEAPAHAPHDDGHRVRRHPQHMRHHVLHLGRMLRGGIDGHLVVLARHGKGDHALEVEVVLPPDPHPSLQPVRRGRHRRLHLAALQLQRLGDEGIARLHRRRHVGDVRQVAIRHHGELRRPPRRVARLGDDREHRLAVELHLAHREDRVVVLAHRADVVHRHVRRGQHADDPGRRANRIEVDRKDLRVRPVRQPEIGVQRPHRLADVVGIFRRAGHVLVRRVVSLRRVHAPADRRLDRRPLHAHHATSRTRRAPSPALSRKNRCSSPFATCDR